MPDENALRRAQLKKSASLRAEFNHQVALERIDFTLDVLEPAKKQIAEAFARGELDDTVGNFSAAS